MLDLNLIPRELRKARGSTSFLVAVLAVLLAANALVAAALIRSSEDKDPGGSAAAGRGAPPPEERMRYVGETIAAVRELLKERRFAEASAVGGRGAAMAETWRNPDGTSPSDVAVHRKILALYIVTAERLLEQSRLRSDLEERTREEPETGGKTVVVRYNGTRFRLPSDM